MACSFYTNNQLLPVAVGLFPGVYLWHNFPPVLVDSYYTTYFKYYSSNTKLPLIFTSSRKCIFLF
jgi:hypothetical protein